MTRDYSSASSSRSASVQAEAELSKVEEAQLSSSFSVIRKACFPCIRRSSKPITQDTEVDKLNQEQESTKRIRRTDRWSDGGIYECSMLKTLSFEQLKVATMNFRPCSTFGTNSWFLFKGWLDEHTLTATEPGMGTAVAVKMITMEKWPVQLEANYLGRLYHPNLVRLIGYCVEQKLLVTEFLPRGSLETHLFSGKFPSMQSCTLPRVGEPETWLIVDAGHSDSQPLLSCTLRMKIALGAAKGLAFLHSAEKPVIHGDFKPSNILLDSEYNTKLCDFGSYAQDSSSSYTIETVYGEMESVHGFLNEYSAPECFRQVTNESHPLVQHGNVARAMSQLENREHVNVDSRLDGQYSREGAKRAALLALQCLSEAATSRPTMDEVVEILRRPTMDEVKAKLEMI